MGDIRSVIRFITSLDIESRLVLILYFIILALCNDAMTPGRIMNSLVAYCLMQWILLEVTIKYFKWLNRLYKNGSSKR